MSDFLNMGVLFSLQDRSAPGFGRVLGNLTRVLNQSYRTERVFSVLENRIDGVSVKQRDFSNSTLRSTIAVTAMGMAVGVLATKISSAIKVSVEYEKQLVNIRNASGFTKDIAGLSSEIKGLSDNMYGLLDVSKAYYQLYSAGLTGTGSGGKSITASAVEMAKTFAIISQGELTLEKSAEIIPQLLSKTGISMSRDFGNGVTEASRLLDKIAAIVSYTRMKVKDIPGMLDSSRTALSEVKGEFEDLLAVTGSLMTAGYSSKESGQAFNMMVRRVSSDVAMLNAQREIFSPIVELKKFTATYKATKSLINGSSPDILNLFGGQEGFQNYVDKIISGGTSISKALSDLQNDPKWESLTGKSKNAIQSWFLALQAESNRVMGGANARKKLFAIGKLFPSQSEYEQSIQDWYSGKKDIIAFYADLEKSINQKVQIKDKEGNVSLVDKYSESDKMGILRTYFGEQAAAQAFLQMTKAVTQVERDIYKVDKAGRYILDNSGQKMREYMKGQILFGTEAVRYFKMASQDSLGFANKFKKAYGESAAGLLQMKEALKQTFQVTMGEGILPIFKDFLGLLNQSLSAINEIITALPGIGSGLGKFATFGGMGFASVTGFQTLKTAGRLVGGMMFKTDRKLAQAEFEEADNLYISLASEVSDGNESLSKRRDALKKAHDMKIKEMEDELASYKIQRKKYLYNVKVKNKIKGMEELISKSNAVTAAELASMTGNGASARKVDFAKRGRDIKAANLDLAKRSGGFGLLFVKVGLIATATWAIYEMWKQGKGIVGEMKKLLMGVEGSVGALAKFKGFWELAKNKGSFTKADTVNNLLNEEQKNRLSVLQATLFEPLQDLGNLYIDTLGEDKGAFGTTLRNSLANYAKTNNSESLKNIEGLIRVMNTAATKGVFSVDSLEKAGMKDAKSYSGEIDILNKNEKTKNILDNWKKVYTKFDTESLKIIEEAKKTAGYNANVGTTLATIYDTLKSFLQRFDDYLLNVVAGVGVGGLIGSLLGPQGAVVGGIVGGIIGGLGAIIVETFRTAFSKKGKEDDEARARLSRILVGISAAGTAATMLTPLNPLIGVIGASAVGLSMGGQMFLKYLDVSDRQERLRGFLRDSAKGNSRDEEYLRDRLMKEGYLTEERAFEIYADLSGSKNFLSVNNAKASDIFKSMHDLSQSKDVGSDVTDSYVKSSEAILQGMLKDKFEQGMLLYDTSTKEVVKEVGYDLEAEKKKYKDIAYKPIISTKSLDYTGIGDAMKNLEIATEDNTRALRKNNDFLYFEMNPSDYNTSSKVSNLDRFNIKNNFPDSLRNSNKSKAQVESMADNMPIERSKSVSIFSHPGDLGVDKYKKAEELSKEALDKYNNPPNIIDGKIVFEFVTAGTSMGTAEVNMMDLVKKYGNQSVGGSSSSQGKKISFKFKPVSVMGGL